MVRIPIWLLMRLRSPKYLPSLTSLGRSKIGLALIVFTDENHIESCVLHLSIVFINQAFPFHIKSACYIKESHLLLLSIIALVGIFFVSVKNVDNDADVISPW